MSSYLSNLLTHTTSRYNSFKRTLLSSEDDGDTEDDTHVCRVLRAYYSEKGRPFPPWLPPDPNDKRAITPQPYAQQGNYFGGTAGKSPYGHVQNQGGQRGSLSDLWDPPSAPANNAPMQPTSLRNARRPMNQPPANMSSGNLAPPQARPLPSQRAGSYQTQGMPQQQMGSRPGSRVEPSPPSSSAGLTAGSAQERLKARLWGGKAGVSPQPSPATSSVGAPNPYDQPQMGANAPWNGGSGNPYDNGGNGRRYGRQ
ncbi:hypothetical protein HII31_01756 [Pseudocercospora fuligena]|uniref:Mso1 N-terminal domain-containing protein n=1 Tax=Pseudocercospora fuligena TaxID=685502 RepID=A0A8H6RTX5_9PEZI|nr:hypothetical protein HII31_01756 [Pseudocercospora fuligena]